MLQQLFTWFTMCNHLFIIKFFFALVGCCANLVLLSDTLENFKYLGLALEIYMLILFHIQYTSLNSCFSSFCLHFFV